MIQKRDVTHGLHRMTYDPKTWRHSRVTQNDLWSKNVTSLTWGTKWLVIQKRDITQGGRQMTLKMFRWNLVIKAKDVKFFQEMKKSYGWWRFASGNVFTQCLQRSIISLVMIPPNDPAHHERKGAVILSMVNGSWTIVTKRKLGPDII